MRDDGRDPAEAQDAPLASAGHDLSSAGLAADKMTYDLELGVRCAGVRGRRLGRREMHKTALIQTTDDITSL